MTRVRRRRDPRGLLGTQMDSGPRLAVLPLPRGVCRSGVTAHPELGGDTALRTPFTGHAGRAGPGAPGGSASSAMSGAVSHQAAERTWATRPSVSTPAPAGFPPWWQDPPRSTALVPGAAAPAGPEPQPRRLLWCGGPRAGTGGSGLWAARVGGRRGPGAHIPGCVQCIHEVLVTAGIAEGQLLGAFQALPVLQGAQGKGRRALVCGGAHAGGSVPAAGPGLFVETGLVMKHNLPAPKSVIAVLNKTEDNELGQAADSQKAGLAVLGLCGIHTSQPRGPPAGAGSAGANVLACPRARTCLSCRGGRGDRDRRRPLLKPSLDPRAPSSPNGQDTCPLGAPNPSRPLTTQTADTWTQPTAAPTVT